MPLEQLIRELGEVARHTGAKPIVFRPSLADTIYHPFFLAGIGTVLSLSCLWGAINLLTMGAAHEFDAVRYSWVLAHAMVFGFVGAFIMGFAYQAVPRFKHTSLWKPRLAFSALRSCLCKRAMRRTSARRVVS